MRRSLKSFKSLKYALITLLLFCLGGSVDAPAADGSEDVPATDVSVVGPATEAVA